METEEGCSLYQHYMTQTTRMDVLRVLLVVKYQSSEQVSVGRPLKEGSLMAEADFNSANGEFDIWTNPSA